MTRSLSWPKWRVKTLTGSPGNFPRSSSPLLHLFLPSTIFKHHPLTSTPPIIQLATRNLHRQPLQLFLLKHHTHYPSEQKSRSYGLSNLYYRQLRLPPVRNGIRAPSPLRLLVSLAHWHASAFQSWCPWTLQVPFVKENGYANLRCNWNPGCLEKHREHTHVTVEVWQNIFSVTSMNKSGSHEAPSQVGAACCAQFAVSRSRVIERPLRDFEHFREWIIDTDMTDAKSGRVLELLWHVIFGIQAV